MEVRFWLVAWDEGSPTDRLVRLLAVAVRQATAAAGADAADFGSGQAVWWRWLVVRPPWHVLAAVDIAPDCPQQQGISLMVASSGRSFDFSKPDVGDSGPGGAPQLRLTANDSW